MTIKEITITERITRGQMMGELNPSGNVVSAAWNVKTRLRKRGIPVIGSLGLVAVEWGTLTIEFVKASDESNEHSYETLDDVGHYADAWVYTWTGKPVPADIDLALVASKGDALVMDKPLSALLTVDEEL
jgi:hypothetical protein